MNSILNFRAEHLTHLSDEQIDDQLIGDLSPEAAAHLADCAACIRRVAEAEAPMSHFRAVATEWSHRRSATMPQIVTAYKPRWAQRFAFGTATAAFLAVAFAIPTISTLHTPTHTRVSGAASPLAGQTVTQAAAVPQASVTEQRVAVRVRPVSQPVEDDKTISRDNQMLQAINVALSTPADSPASLGLETVSSEQSTPQHSPALLQD